MAHVLLVFPYPTEEQVVNISPPLSILYVGASLEAAGVSVSYVDMRQHSLEDLQREIDKNPLAVGISTMTGFQLAESLTVIREVKNRCPQTPIVLGGVHPSLLPAQTLSDSAVDFVVIGEGEITMVELIHRIDSKSSKFGDIKGLGWKTSSGEIVLNERRPFMDLEKQVAPITKSSAPLYSRYPMVKVQVARGCPFGCSFCYNTVYNRRKYREKPLETIDREIQQVKALAPQVKHISLLADEIGFNHKRIVSIAKIAAKYNSSFHTAIRAENIDDALIECIGDCCDELLIGVEHVSPRIRALIRKGNDIGHVLVASKAIARSNIRPVWSFMTAFPEETEEETFANMDFADRLKAQNPRAVVTPFFITTPYPGTELFEVAMKYGYVAPQTFRDWRNFALSNISMPWIDVKTQRFSDLYGISSILYMNKESYSNTEFEKSFFEHIQSIAHDRWTKRDLTFMEEWELFLTYNRHTRGKIHANTLL